MINFILNHFKSNSTCSYPMTIAARKIKTTMTPSNANSKLIELRKLMEKHSLAAYYIPSEDSHQVNKTKVLIFFQFVCRVNIFLKGTVGGLLLVILPVQQVTKTITGNVIITRTHFFRICYCYNGKGCTLD